MPIFRSKKPAVNSQPVQGGSHANPISTDDPLISQSALEAGNLPPSAIRRLESLSTQKSFTSDLTINEFALLKASGFHPICQVAGTAVYKIGYQPIPYGGSQSLSVISNAFNEARRLALGRLQQEAHLAHADVVVGTRITQGMFDVESGLIEFSLIGTAVKNLNKKVESPTKTSSLVALTTLSGQELYQLSENGFFPVGLVGASSCYFASLSPYTFQQMYSMLGANTVNFEVREFTEGYYATRRLVMREVESAAKALRASGIIDFKFTSTTNSYQAQSGERESVAAVSFLTHVLATAITEISNTPQGKQLKIMYVNP